MPIYEYTCKKCNDDFEMLVSSGDEVSCSSCGSTQVTRRLSLFAVSSSTKAMPECACGEGFDKGRCGSGMCGAN